MKIIMITKLDLSSHSVRKIVTQESLLKINFFSPIIQGTEPTQSVVWVVPVNPEHLNVQMMSLQKFYENIIPKIAYLLVANNLF